MRSKPGLSIAFFAVVGITGYFAHEHALRANTRSGPEAEQATPVSLATAERANFPVLLRGLGTVLPFNTVTVRSRVDGELVKIAFREGQTVQQGDLLAQIDPRPYQAALDQAVAKKAQDDATLSNAKLDLDRYSTLAKQEFASRQQLDTQVAAVAQGTALVQADQAAIENAQTQLGYTSITSPITGRVGFRLVDQGNIVNASSQSGIATITQVRPISVLFTLPEGQIDRINKALARGRVPVSAYTADGSRKLADGTLTVVNNQVDTTTGVIHARAGDDGDRPGAARVGSTRDAIVHLSGYSPSIPAIALSGALDDPVGAGRRLTDPGYPVRKLHPSADDPLDAAVGRARRDRLADAGRL